VQLPAQPPVLTGPFGQGSADAAPYLVVLRRQHQVHRLRSERPRGEDGAVQDQVRTGQGKRGVLEAGRLALAHVDDHGLATGRAGGGLELGREREARASASADVHRGEARQQLRQVEPWQGARGCAVRLERRAVLDALEQARAWVDVDLVAALA
jgi:hypothetical protein